MELVGTGFSQVYGSNRIPFPFITKYVINVKGKSSSQNNLFDSQMQCDNFLATSFLVNKS